MRKFGQLKTILLIFSVALLLLIVAFAFNQNDSDELILFNESFTINQTPAILLENDNSSEMQNYSEIISNPETEFSITPIIQINNYKLNPKTEEYLSSVSDNQETNNYLVKFKNEIVNDKISKFSSKKEFSSDLVRLNGDAESIALLLNDSEVEYIELDQKTSILADNIPYGVSLTDAHLYWNITNGSGVKVAVLDTGIALHDDLMVFGGVSFVSSDYYDYNGHGTAVAGVLSAILNDNGLVGVAPSASIYSVKIMNDSFGSLSDAIFAIEWCIDNNISIVSMSFGMDSYSQIFKEVLDDAYNSGILLVAAAGNNNGSVLYPAAYSSVIAVGAVDSSLQRASFSSYGNELELVAAGVDINSTSLNNGYSIGSGTSFSAPVVSGAAVLIKSFNTSLTNEQIRAKLRNDALDLGSAGKDDYYGYGLVRVNLSSNNYNLANESYFYEIFNISYYKTENESYTFWQNGTGTIDDMNFSEGYYLIKKYIPQLIQQKIYVDENGTVKILTDFEWDDDFTYEGSGIDHMVWQSGSLDFKYDDYGQDDVECYDNDYSASSGFQHWKCWARGTTALNNCRSKHSDLDSFCTGSSYCYNNSIGEWHSLPTSTRDERYIKRKVYELCAGSISSSYSASTPDYHIIDAKKTYCLSSTTFRISGRYSSTEYINIPSSSHDCSANTECDSSVAGNYVSTTYNYNFDLYNNPCRTSDGYTCSVNSSCLTNHYCVHSYCRTNITYCGDGYCDSGESCSQDCTQLVPLCNGTFNLHSQYSDSTPLSSSYVYLNNISNSTTNSDGYKQLKFNNLLCGTKENVSVYCPANQSKLCEAKSEKIDFNGDVDNLYFNCDICRSTYHNLNSEINDIFIKYNSGNIYDVTITVHSTNIDASSLNVSLKLQSKTTGLISNEISGLISSLSGVNDYNITFTVNLNDVNYLHIYLDPNNEITEDKKDNYVFVPVITNKLKANLSVNTGYSTVNDAIRNYLRFYVDDVSQSEADTIISIGQNTPEVSAYNDKTKIIKPISFGIDGGQVITNLGKMNHPYAGIVGNYYDHLQSKDIIFIYGNEIDGTVAAVKKFISARDIVFSSIISIENGYSNVISGKVIVQDDYDINAIAVYDLLHNYENNPYYGKNTSEFADVVTNILNDNNYEVSIMTVKTLNTTSYNQSTILRLKHVNSDYSQEFKDAVVNNSRPVVFAGGIFSNLESWENNNGLAKQLATDNTYARDVWEIELTGGPTQDCDNCPDYTYQDLVDYYWPSLMAGIKEYSQQNEVDYVGHSNGGRVALSSLNLYSISGKNNAGYYFDYDTGDYTYSDLPSNFINKFVGVAIPTTLNDATPFTNSLRKYICSGQGSSLCYYLPNLSMVKNGDYAISSLNSSNYKHVTLTDFGWRLVFYDADFFVGLTTLKESLNFNPSRISLNLMSFYNQIGQETNTTINYQNVSVNELYLFNSKPDDIILGFDDQQRIFNSTNITIEIGTNYSSNYIGWMYYNHADIINNKLVKTNLMGALK